MNIVILNDSGTVNGGAAKVALEEARALAIAGHQVYLVCGAGPVAPDLHDLPNLTVYCVAEHDILQDPNRLRAITRGLWNQTSRRCVASLLASLSPRETVVHVHNFAKALSSSVVRAALDLGFEVVVTLHDFQLACPTGNLFIHRTQRKCTLRPMSTACICTNCDVRNYQTKLWRVARQAIQNRCGRLPNGIKHFAYVSQMALDLMRPHLPQGATFYPLPNAIEIGYAPPANVAANSFFLFLGRLVTEKGPELFARAAAAEEVSCRFIGSGAAWEAVAKANPRAIMSGWMNHADSMEALRGARALVFPSLWYETLGLVVLEAAAMGVPSIVADSCAARESVADGVTGLHFHSGEEASLREKIAEMKNEGLAARMGKAAHDRFWSPPGFGVDLHRKRLESIYIRVLSRTDAEHKDMDIPAGTYSQ